MTKKMLVNSKTGEIIEAEELCPFASITDLKRDNLHDGEDYVEGTSVTTLEGYEPLESIVARCMRTVKSPNGTTYQVLDSDALKAEETQQGIYEAEGAKSLDEAFDTIDPSDEQGFDLADVSAIQSSVSQKLNKELSTQEGSEDNLKSQATDEVVGNSESAFPEKQNTENA